MNTTHPAGKPDDTQQPVIGHSEKHPDWAGRKVTDDLLVRLEALESYACCRYPGCDTLLSKGSPDFCPEHQATTKTDAAELAEPYSRRVWSLPVLDVLAERQRQQAKWGTQYHDPAGWLPILVEEVGEVGKAIFEKSTEEYRKELIQVAAVAVAAVEEFDRRRATLADQKVNLP